MLEKTLNNKRIVVIHQRDWGVKHGFEISKKLYKCGAKLGAINFKKSTEYLIENQKDLKFDSIINESDISDNTRKILLQNQYNLKDFKNDFDIDNIWKFASTLRHYSLSYKKKFPFSYEQSQSDEEIKNYILAFALKLKEFFINFNPDLVIGYNFGDIRHHLIEKICNKNKIPFFFSSDTKVQNINCFYYDINSSRSFFIDRVKKLNNNIINSKNYFNAEKYIRENNEKFKIAYHMKNMNLNKRWYNFDDFKKLLSSIRYHFKKIKINKKILSASDNTNLFYLIRDYVSERKNIIETQNFKSYDNLDKVGRFIFFPLQHFPESQLGLLNPVHDHVLNTIKILARHLPSELTLVVKDHPWSFGKRSKSFLSKIKNTINVKFLKPNTPNNLIYEKMDYLISLGGTVIFEAALYNKPAISIGNLEMMSELPNLFRIKNLEDIKDVLKEIDKNFKNINNSNEYNRKLNNYIAAALDLGYRNDIYQSDLRLSKKNLEYIWNFYLKEINKIFRFKGKFLYN